MVDKPITMTLKVAVFSSKKYDIDSFNDTNTPNSGIEFDYYDVPLNAATAPLAANHEAVCVFVNDQLNKEVSFFSTFCCHIRD